MDFTAFMSLNIMWHFRVNCFESRYEREAKCKISFENAVLFSDDTGKLGKRKFRVLLSGIDYLRPSDYH